MQRHTRIWTLVALICIAFAVFAGCGGNPAAGKTSVILWGYADDEEAESTWEIVEWYNENNTDGIYIDYYPQPSGTYASLAERALASKKGPDVFYVGIAI